MKKSTMVTLVLSGALISGCDDRSHESVGSAAAADWQSGSSSSEVITNNTYSPSHGYYHAHYGGWYPYPYNYYRPGYGYYHGGSYSQTPHMSAVSASRPMTATTPSSSTHVTRGGFGSSGHVSS